MISATQKARQPYPSIHVQHTQTHSTEITFDKWYMCCFSPGDCICLCEATIHYDTGQHLQNCVGVKINKGLYQMSTICICPSTANSKFLSSDKTHIFPLCSIVICPCTIHHKSGFPTRQPLILTFSFIIFGLTPELKAQ